MKKTLILTVALIATTITSQAISFAWGTPTIMRPGGSGNVGGGIPVNMLFLGNSGISGQGTFNYVTFFTTGYSVVATENTASSAPIPGNIGRIVSKTVDFGPKSETAAKAMNNNVYAAIVSYAVTKDLDGKDYTYTYYNLSQTFTMSGIAADNWDPGLLSFGFTSWTAIDHWATWGVDLYGNLAVNDKGETAMFKTQKEALEYTWTLAGTTGWNSFNTREIIAIPEPATAAMALAGLALLFRRKRK